jgi:peptide-N4-(N-acetyl-beta-glucosaminyl)asparagine amidase
MCHLHDALVHELLAWFKADFFTWVNSPPCCRCGGSTRHRGLSAPTEEETAGLATRVESYECESCSAETRFPRYNHPGVLLRTRRGRCGEWANAFTLVANACGLTARYCLDFSDHVWTEIWAPHLSRWTQADSCEAARDTPLLYEQGWGKRLAYVLAFEAQGPVADVTPRYVISWREALGRRAALPEAWVSQHLEQATQRQIAIAPPRRRKAMLQRARADATQLSACIVAGGGALPVVQELPGRQSGAVEWRAARGELGESASARQSRIAIRYSRRVVQRLAAALAKAMTDVQERGEQQ